MEKNALDAWDWKVCREIMLMFSRSSVAHGETWIAGSVPVTEVTVSLQQMDIYRETEREHFSHLPGPHASPCHGRQSGGASAGHDSAENIGSSIEEGEGRRQACNAGGSVCHTMPTSARSRSVACRQHKTQVNAATMFPPKRKLRVLRRSARHPVRCSQRNNPHKIA